MVMKNLYEILDIPNSANSAEIKFAYKKMVRLYHPDINKSKDAEIKFKLLNNAYSVLSDIEKRKNYDNLLNISKREEKTPHPDKNSIIKEIKITDVEQKEGTTRTVNILNKQLCPKCMGSGFLKGFKCSFCKGQGEKQEFRQIEIKIKKDIKDNELIYVDKVNSSALYDKNLFLRIKIEPPSKTYFEEGKIISDIYIPFYDAVLGCELEINIPNYGLTKVLIPEASKEGDKIKLDIENKQEFYAKVNILMPKKITNEEKNLFIKLKQTIEASKRYGFAG